MYRFILSLVFAITSFSIFAQTQVKYVFLLIGDGFGPNERIVAEKAIGTPLVMNSLPSGKLPMGTDTFDGKTTDSAASGTAIAVGQKTHLYAIGMDKDDKPVESLAAELKRTRGFSIGIISSCGMTDGTPAAQYAHQPKRYNYEKIADEMVSSDFDLFAGFDIFESPDIGNREKLEAAYRQKLRDAGRDVLEGADAFSKAVPGKKAYIACPPYVEWAKKPSFFGGLFGGKHISLADYLSGAIRLFESNPKGFYIMLECGRIDHSGHNNDAGMLVREVRAFDEAIAVALNFQKKHPEETLVIVTADHETGGLLIEDMKKLEENASLLWDQTEQMEAASERWASKKTAVTDEMLEKIFGVSFSDTERTAGFSPIRAQKNPRPWAFIKAASTLRDQRLGIKYTKGGHTNTKVVTNVSGPGWQLFTKQPLENSSLRGLITDILNGKR